MEDTINKRFQRIVDEVYAGNKRAFATAAGLSATVIENVVGARQGKPSYDVIYKVCSNANISPLWLLTGEGPMLRPDAPAPAAATPPITAPTAPESPLEAHFREVIKEKDAEISRLNREIGALKAGGDLAFRDYLSPIGGKGGMPENLPVVPELPPPPAATPASQLKQKRDPRTPSPPK